jgi:hypothetical protein
MGSVKRETQINCKTDVPEKRGLSLLIIQSADATYPESGAGCNINKS